MKVRIVVRPSGLVDGKDWPDVGEEMDLPDVVAEGMIGAGHVEAVEKGHIRKTEKRPASKADVEKRGD